MPLQWSTTDQESVNAGCKILVYSESGMGKTTLCGTAPNPVILSAEAGLLPLKRLRIPVIKIKTVNDLTEAHKWLISSVEAQQFATVCIDSISEIAEVVLQNAKPQVKDPRQAYGEMIDKMSMVIRSFRDIHGKHVYMAAKAEPIKDEMSGALKYGPSMPGRQLGPQLPYFFDEVFALRIGRTQDGTLFRYLQTQPDLQYIAKERSGELAMMEIPDLNVVFTKMMGAKT